MKKRTNESQKILNCLFENLLLFQKWYEKLCCNFQGGPKIFLVWLLKKIVTFKGDGERGGNDGRNIKKGVGLDVIKEEKRE